MNYLFNHKSIYRTIHLSEQKSKVIGESSKYSPEVHKLYVPYSADSSIFAINFLHELCHYVLGETSFSTQLRAMIYLCDFLNANSFAYQQVCTQNSESPIRQALHQAIDNISMAHGLGDSGYYDSQYRNRRFFNQNDEQEERIRYSKDEKYIQFLSIIKDIRGRYDFLTNYSRLVNEGIATYLSLNIGLNDDVIFFSEVFRRVVQNIEETRKRQSEIRDDILALPNGNDYKKGYMIAKHFHDRYDLSAVFMSGILALTVPFFNFDLISCKGKEFNELANQYFYADGRWQCLCDFSNNAFDYYYSGIAASNLLTHEKIIDFCNTLIGVRTLPERSHSFAEPDMHVMAALVSRMSFMPIISLLGTDHWMRHYQHLKEAICLKEGNPDKHIYSLCNKGYLDQFLSNSTSISSYLSFIESQFNTEGKDYYHCSGESCCINERDVEFLIDRETCEKFNNAVFDLYVERMGKQP